MIKTIGELKEAINNIDDDFTIDVRISWQTRKIPERTFYIGNKICDYYNIHIKDNGYEITELVQEDNIEGFIQCLKFFNYIQILKI